MTEPPDPSEEASSSPALPSRHRPHTSWEVPAAADADVPAAADADVPAAAPLVLTIRTRPLVLASGQWTGVASPHCGEMISTSSDPRPVDWLPPRPLCPRAPRPRLPRPVPDPLPPLPNDPPLCPRPLEPRDPLNPAEPEPL